MSELFIKAKEDDAAGAAKSAKSLLVVVGAGAGDADEKLLPPSAANMLLLLLLPELLKAPKSAVNAFELLLVATGAAAPAEGALVLLPNAVWPPKAD